LLPPGGHHDEVVASDVLRLALAGFKLDDNPNLWCSATISPGPAKPLEVAPSVFTGPDHIAAVQFVEVVFLHLIEGVCRPIDHAITQDLTTQSPNGVVVEGFI